MLYEIDKIRGLWISVCPCFLSWALFLYQRTSISPVSDPWLRWICEAYENSFFIGFETYFSNQKMFLNRKCLLVHLNGEVPWSILTLTMVQKQTYQALRIEPWIWDEHLPKVVKMLFIRLSLGYLSLLAEKRVQSLGIAKQRRHDRSAGARALLLEQTKVAKRVTHPNVPHGIMKSFYILIILTVAELDHTMFPKMKSIWSSSSTCVFVPSVYMCQISSAGLKLLFHFSLRSVDVCSRG